MRKGRALRRASSAPLLVIASALFGACGGGSAQGTAVIHPVAKSSTSTSSAPPAPKPKQTPAVSIGQFGGGTFGPRVVRSAKGSIVISGQRSSSGRRWIVQALDDKLQPRADLRHEIAEAPEDTSNWDVQAVADGFVLAWTRPTDAGEQLLVVSLDADGAARGAPNVVSRSGDDLVAVMIVPLGKGDASTPAALLTYGEQSVAKGSNVATGALFAIGVDAVGRPIGATPSKLAEHLSAWQVQATGPTTAVVGLIERDVKGLTPANPEEAPRTAKVSTLTYASKGLTLSEALTLTSGETALPDIRVVMTGPGRALAVWEDRRELDTHVFAQAIDLTGGKPKAIGAAKRAAPPRGDQSLTSLVMTKSGPVLLWEAYHPRPTHDQRRRFELVRLNADGEAMARPRAFWFPYEEQQPEFVVGGDRDPSGNSSSDEVALLTYGQACTQQGDSPPSCDDKDLRPFLVRFSGPTLALEQATLLDVGDVVAGTALHAFDLACTASECNALIDGPGDPATVAIARVAKGATPAAVHYAYTDVIEQAANPPRLEGATAVARESQFAGLHAVRTNANGAAATLVAWITYAADEEIDVAAPTVIIETGKKKKEKPPKKPKPKSEGGARVAVRLLDAGGEPLAPIAVVSERALSKGDVAIAAGAADKDGAIVAYVSRAEGDEEVYVARIDPNGKKSGKSGRITHAEGSASDVALVSLPDGGYLLAWVDGRKDVAAVYAVRLDKSGAKQGTEVKIGGGIGGDLSDLTLSLNGSGSAGARVIAAWSDARDDLTTGFGDVYFTVVSGKDPSKAIIAERPLEKSKLHSHDPSVSTRSDGSAVFAWLEDDPQATEIMELSGKPDWGAYVARVDASGALVQPPTQLTIDPALGKGVVSGVALDCATSGSAGGCRTVLAYGQREGVALLGATISATSMGPAREVWSYLGAPTQEVAPSLVGSASYLCEDGLDKDDARVRRLSIGW